MAPLVSNVSPSQKHFFSNQNATFFIRGFVPPSSVVFTSDGNLSYFWLIGRQQDADPRQRWQARHDAQLQAHLRAPEHRQREPGHGVKVGHLLLRPLLLRDLESTNFGTQLSISFYEAIAHWIFRPHDYYLLLGSFKTVSSVNYQQGTFDEAIAHIIFLPHGGYLLLHTMCSFITNQFREQASGMNQLFTTLSRSRGNLLQQAL